ncbi:molybdenum cofactor guanylyltransferase [Pseudoxanthomonas indica]|uniref:Molybdenum cofactor guanylyltransferase n=1 Tax=Pseudoxanthomonas indica TaxID=428993 RepID=A0A1T5IKK1_9GAMM|nr:molybdenum cofactor guanylyltransferase [Pseudoxanthomonas indica]
MTTAVSPPWTGIVLAGGQSSRMGSDKALLPWGARTLLDQARSRLLSAGAARVVVSGRSGREDEMPDEQRGQGPLSALAQLAPRLDDGVLVIVPVDMPLLSNELLQQLAGAPGACAAFEFHPLPMRLELATPVRAVLARLSLLPEVQRSLRTLQRELGGNLLEGSHWQEELRGCNTPEEWKALLQTAGCPASDDSN